MCILAWNFFVYFLQKGRVTIVLSLTLTTYPHQQANKQITKYSIKGPKLAHCDTVVEEALEAYWRSKSEDGLTEWHLHRGAEQDANSQE